MLEKTIDEDGINRLKAQLDYSTKELAKVSKFSSFGEIAGGVAHEINNSLAVIHGKSNLLLNMIKNKEIDEEKMISYLEKIYATVEKSAKIVKDLQRFTEIPDKESFLPANLLEIAHKSIELIKENRTLNGITINLNIPEEIIFDCRVTKITECFINIISNSIEAIDNLKEKWIKIEAKEEGEIIEIRVTDCGQGIKDPAILAGLMHPFFTTKEVGKGAGLGLVILKGIISSHKGEFFYNKDSENTQFIMRVPKNLKEHNK